MPDQPTWLERVPHILNALHAPAAPPFLDRSVIEQLFGVRRRQAISLLHRFEGYQTGRTFVVPRESVARFLEPLAAGEPLQAVKAQKRRVAEFLGQARHTLTLPRIALPPPQLPEITLAGLPPGIHVLPGQLSIQFAGATDLLEKLVALSQALVNDFATLESAFATATPPAREDHARSR